MRILIVEDDPVCRELLGRILKPYAQCDVAPDGEQALALYRTALEAGAMYDVMFVDIMMPNMDGQQFCSLVRDIEEDRGINLAESVKVIMTTSLDDEENVFEAHVSGWEAYLVKPLSRKKILEELTRLGFEVEKGGNAGAEH